MPASPSLIRSGSVFAVHPMATRRPLRLAIHLLAIGVAWAVLPAWAQQADTAAAESSVALDSVIITGSQNSAVTEGTESYTARAARTATPLSLSLRETPQSVSVVTQQRIQDQDMQTIMDVVNNATGVSVNRYETNRAQFNARGFEINSLMIDGVPTIWEQPWSSGEVFSSLAMYDRVEIVRGANGLMAGAGDPSASINLVHKRASSRELKGSVQVSGGSFDTYGTLGDVSMALNEAGTVRGRLVGEYSDGDSQTDLHANQRQMIYGTMDIDLTPDTVLWFGLSQQETNSDSPMWGGLPVWYADGSRTDWSRSKTSSAGWSQWDSSYDNYFANLEHTFANGWQASLGYSRGIRKSDSFLLYVSGNPDRTQTTPMSTFPGSYKVETTQDDYSLRFNGPLELFGRDHEFAFGYVDSRQNFDADVRNAQTGFGGIADFDGYNGDFPEPVWSSLAYYGESKIKQQGLYGVGRFNLTDDLKLILGSRISNYKKDATDIYAARPTGIDVEHEVTPYAGVIYDLTETLSAYASYTDIFLPQSVRDLSGEFLDPIVGESMELGLKSELFDGRLNASAAIFQIKQDNLGRSTGVVIPGTLAEFGYEEAEGATSQGYELEISGELAQGWNFTAGYTQFKAEDAEGDRVNTLYPTKLLRTFTTYRLPGTLSKLTVGGGVNWQGNIYTTAVNPAGNPERIEQESYSLVNLMARYDITENLSAQLNADNVFDKKYFDIFDAYGALTYGEPRTLTASAKYRF